MDEQTAFGPFRVNLVDKALPRMPARPYSSFARRGPGLQESGTAGACIGGKRARGPAVPSGVSVSPAARPAAVETEALANADIAGCPIDPPPRGCGRGWAVDEGPRIGPVAAKVVDKPVSKALAPRLSFGLPAGAAGQLAMRPVLAPVPPRSLLWWWRQRLVTRSSFGRFAVSGRLRS